MEAEMRERNRRSIWSFAYPVNLDFHQTQARYALQLVPKHLNHNLSLLGTEAKIEVVLSTLENSAIQPCMSPMLAPAFPMCQTEMGHLFHPVVHIVMVHAMWLLPME